MLHKHLGLGWNFLAKDQCPINSRKMRKDALADDVVSSVTAFYNRSDISREMPNARMVSKKTDREQGARIQYASSLLTVQV